MPATMTLAAAAMHFAKAATLVEAEKEHLLHQIGHHVATEAKHLIGHEGVAGAGPFAAWAPLADITVEDKSRLGYTGQVSSSDPLLRTGELRQSIVFHVDLPDSSVTIGSGSDHAVEQEMGTSHIPPRSFLGIAAEHAKPYITSRVLQAIMVVFQTVLRSSNVGEAAAGRRRDAETERARSAFEHEVNSNPL